MTAVAIMLAGALVAFFFATHIVLQEQEKLHVAERAAWTDERRELLNRIQHPEILPTAASAPFVVPEFEPDDIGQVGEIEFDVEKLLADL